MRSGSSGSIHRSWLSPCGVRIVGEGLAAVLGAVEADVDDVDRVLVLRDRRRCGCSTRRAGAGRGRRWSSPRSRRRRRSGTRRRPRPRRWRRRSVGVDGRDRDADDAERALGQARVLASARSRCRRRRCSSRAPSPGRRSPGCTACAARARCWRRGCAGWSGRGPGRRRRRSSLTKRTRSQVLPPSFDAVDAALLVGAEEVAEHRGVDEVGVARSFEKMRKFQRLKAALLGRGEISY